MSTRNNSRDRAFQDFNLGGRMEELAAKAVDAEVVADDLTEYDRKVIEYDADRPAESARKLEDLLKNSFKEILQKNNIKDITYKDFRDIVNGLSEYSRREAEFNKLYLSRLTSAITDATLIKTVMALGMLIDSAIAKIAEIAKNTSGESYLVLVATIEKTFLWIEKIEELKRRYYISGVDASMKQMSSDQEEAAKAAAEQKLSVDQIRQLISRTVTKPKETASDKKS